MQQAIITIRTGVPSGVVVSVRFDATSKAYEAGRTTEEVYKGVSVDDVMNIAEEATQALLDS